MDRLLAHSLPLVLLLALGCGEPPPKPVDEDRINASPEQEAEWRALSHDEKAVARGREIYFTVQANCQHCHGRDGLGKVGFGPNLRDDYWIYGSDMSDLLHSITYGRNTGTSPMPGLVGRMDEQDMLYLAAYIANWNRTAKANGTGFRRRAIETEDPIDW